MTATVKLRANMAKARAALAEKRAHERSAPLPVTAASDVTIIPAGSRAPRGRPSRVLTLARTRSFLEEEAARLERRAKALRAALEQIE